LVCKRVGHIVGPTLADQGDRQDPRVGSHEATIVVAHVERTAIRDVVETADPRPKPLPEDGPSDIRETLEHSRIAIVERVDVVEAR
jgi:hypothetical protein